MFSRLKSWLQICADYQWIWRFTRACTEEKN